MMPGSRESLGSCPEGVSRYEALFAYHPHAAYAVDLDGYYTAANEKSQAMTGLTLEQMKKTHFSEVIHPDDLHYIQEGFDRALAGESSVIDGRVRQPDGSLVDIRCTAIPIFQDGEVVGVHGVTEDTTEANKVVRDLESALAAVRESTERYSSFFHNQPHGAYALDLEGFYTDVNSEALKMTGLTFEETIGKHFSDLAHPDDLHLIPPRFERVMRGETQTVEHRMISKDGVVHDSRTTGIPIIVNGEVVGVHGLSEDITESKRILREREEAYAAKSLFLANVSHEVRTPLTSIMASVELLEDNEPNPANLRYIDIVKRNSHRLLGLMNQILDFSQLESKTLVARSNPFAVSELMAAIEDWAPAYAENKKLALSMAIDQDTPEMLIGDLPRLIQILTNLVQNALKYTHEGGVKISIGLKHGECEAGMRLLRIQVEDTGVGIPEDKVETMFEPFIQENSGDSSSWNGVGLGLSICCGLAQLMGGDIQVSSVRGEGSTFTCAIPVLLPSETSPSS